MKDHKLTILKLVNDARIGAQRADRRATADYAAQVAGKCEWDQARPDDGVGSFSRCPYNPEQAEIVMQQARKHHKFMEEVYQLAVETFVV